LRHSQLAFLLAAVAALEAPLCAAVVFQSMTPTLASPQPLGTSPAWTVTATDTNPGPLTFQFNIISPTGVSSMVYDFSRGAYSSGLWTAQFKWTTIAAEGTYQVQVVAKDFNSGETATQTESYQLTSRLVGGKAAVRGTANPLVALFSAPACPLGSNMQVIFQSAGGVPAGTDWKPCSGNTSTNFYVAGMYPTTTYTMNYQVQINGVTTPGPSALSFTTGALPAGIAFPTFTVNAPGQQEMDTQQGMVVFSLGDGATRFPVATDLSGRIMWYYRNALGPTILTRPLSDETMLGLQNGPAWNSFTQVQQQISEFDLAGNIVHQSNTGVIQQELLALGAVDAIPCSAVASPPPVGAACLTFFNHELMRMPNGYTVTLAALEKIFPPGTQGNTSSQPVNVAGDLIVVLDTNWQVVWYWDSFNPAGGGNGYPNLPVSRKAILSETCSSLTNLCGPIFLGPNVPASDNQWIHANAIYYMPSSGDFLLSLRNQDWLLKIDYNNGAGTGDVLWRLGNGGDFAFNNTNNDPWPWFSGQHDAEYANNGAGPLIVFDDGNSRRANPPLGLGASCSPFYCSSRGMALTVDETNMTVTPVVSQYLGQNATAYGSAQLLSNGNYFFDAGEVGNISGFGIEVAPMAGQIDGTNVYSIAGQPSYRTYRLTNLYQPLMDLPARLTKTAGDAQSASLWQPYATPLAVMVTDANGIPVQGIQVNFTVVQGSGGQGGTFAGSASIFTDATGTATAPMLTANGNGGTFAIVATVNALSVMFTLTNVYYELASAQTSVGSGAGSGSVLLLCNGPWTANGNAPWLTLPAGSAAGTGNALIQFSYSANPNAAAQIGTLTIAGLTFTVNQAGTSFVPVTALNTLVSSGLISPQGVAVDASGNVYIADSGNNAIKEWNVNSQQVGTLVSTGLLDPSGLAVDSQGNVYIADEKHNAIKKWTASTGLVTSLVPGLASPVGVAVDNLGNVYFSDTSHHYLDEWNAATHQLTKLVTSGLITPTGVAVDGAGNVYFADQKQNVLEEWNATTLQVSTLLSGLKSPFGVAVDGQGNVYFSETGTKSVKEWSPATGQVTVLISSGLKYPSHIAVDGQGNVYVADLGNQAIVKVTAAYVSLGVTSLNEGAAAGSDAVPVQVLPPTFTVTATSNQPWLTVAGFASGNIFFSFTGNTSLSSRTAQVALLGQHVTVTQAADGPANLTKSSGDGQSAPPGGSFSTPLQVNVTDANNLSLPGVAVTFTVTPDIGGASGAFASSPPMPILTDVNGNATAPQLTANGIAGTFTVTASAGILTATFSATITPD
jgi:streptogramin lyase